MTIDELERAVLRLPPEELDAFSAWFAEFQAELRLPALTDAVTFEDDMVALADGTEDLRPYSGTYSREDIYADHD